MNTRDHVSRGVTAGVLGGAAFAALFLIVDTINGSAMRTPAYMGNLVFSFAALPSALTVLLFTLLHFAGFAIVGVLISKVLESAELPPSIPIGMALGFLLFDVVFYASVLVLGVDVVSVLGWPLVLAGNVLAGAVMLGYLRAKSGLRVMDVRGALERHEVVRAGLITGLIGGAIVAVWFFIVDAIQGRLFYTFAALGSALFFGVNDPSQVNTSPTVVLGYTLLHFVAFFGAGLVAAWLVDEADRHPPVLLGLAMLFITLEVVSLGFLSAVATWLFQTVPWWTPIVANLLAGAGMAWYLWRTHPSLREHLSHSLEDDPVTTA